MKERVTVACIQAEPVPLDLERTIDTLDGLVAEAAAQGAQLAVFPEAFLPAYPSSRWAGFLAGGSDAKPVFARLARESVEIPGPASDRLAEVGRASCRERV